MFDKLKNFFKKESSEKTTKTEEVKQEPVPEQEVQRSPKEGDIDNPIAKCNSCGINIFFRKDKKTVDNYVLCKKCYRKMKKQAKKQSPI